MKELLTKGCKSFQFFLMAISIIVTASAAADELQRWDTMVTQYNKSVVDRFHPQFDFDNDGCYPATPFDRYHNLAQNPGLNATGTLGGACSDSNWGDFANTLHRQLCKIQYTSDGQILRCAHFYELYFEKDQAVGFSFLGGHKHDIETVIVWTGQVWKSGQYSEYVTHVSTSAHGNYTTQPYNNTIQQSGHPLVVYHKDGAGTHAFRHANQNDKDHVEFKGNWGQFYAPNIMSYYAAVHWWTGDEWDRYRNNKWYRDTLRGSNFGSASSKIRTENVLISEANKAIPKSDTFWSAISFTIDDAWYTRSQEFAANYPGIYHDINE